MEIIAKYQGLWHFCLSVSGISIIRENWSKQKSVNLSLWCSVPRQTHPHLDCVSRQPHSKQLSCYPAVKCWQVPVWAASFALLLSKLCHPGLHWGTLFCDSQTCSLETLINWPLFLHGWPLHVLHLKLLFPINTHFSWHLSWQIFRLWPDSRIWATEVEELLYGPWFVITSPGHPQGGGPVWSLCQHSSTCPAQQCI